MKRFKTIKSNYFLTLLCLLVAISTNAALRTQTVERWNGTTTYDGTNLSSVSNNTFIGSGTNVTFYISNIKEYYNVLGVRRLDYSDVSANSSMTSNFSWVATTNYNVQVTKISAQVRGYQSKLLLKAAYAQFSGGAEVRCATNSTGTSGAQTVSVENSDGLSNPIVFTMRATDNSTGFSIHNINFTYTITQDVPVFQYKSIAYGSEGGNVYSSWESFEKATAAEVTHEKFDGNITTTTDGIAQTAYFKAVPQTGYVFIGWKRNADDVDYVSTNAEYSEELTSKSNDDANPALITLYAVFSAKNTPLFSGSNQTLNVGANQVTDFAFQYTSSSIPSADTNSDFYYSIEQTPDATTKEGSADATQVVAYDPATNTLTGLNSGTAVIIFTQKESTNYYAASQSYEITVNKNTATLTNNLGTAYKVDDAANVVDCYTASNNEVEVEVESSNTDVIAVVEGNLKAVGVGTATVTFRQAETYKWTELSVSQTITISKYDLSASISQNSTTWDAAIHNPFAVTYNLTNHLNDFTIQSLDPAIATYADGAIQTYAETGTARFLVSRPEDYKFNQLAKTLSINVTPAPESCYVLEDNNEHGINTYNDPVKYNLSGIGETLSVIVHKQDWGTYGFTITGYDALTNGNATPLLELSNDQIPTDYGSPFTCSVPESIVRIEVTSGGTLNKYFKELRISRALFLTPSTDAITMSSSKGQDATATFDVSYGSCGGTIKVISDNPKITVSPTSFYAEGNGTQTITITGDASEEGTETAIITIYDQSKKTTVTFTNTTVGKLATHIEYKGEASYDQGAGAQPNPFHVIDANGNEVAGAKVTMASSKIAVLSVSEDGVSSFTPSCGGNVTLTATYAGDEAHQPSSLSQSIFVEKCAPHIEWQQSLMGFTATAEGEIDETVLLLAKTVNDEGADIGIPITYTIADPSIATLIDNGDGTYSVHVTTVGETTITATTAEDDTYAIESVTHSIRVRREGEACHSFAIEHAGELSVFMGGTTEELIINGLPCQLTFEAKRGGGAIGNEITIQYYDGNSWQNLQSLNITGSWTSYGPYTVPEVAQRLRFQGSGTLSRKIRNIYVTQQTYLRASVDSISFKDEVHNSFSQSFTVSYSDIPVIQYSIVCDNPNISLALTTDRPVNNNCGDYGTYTFTLSGSSNIPANYCGSIHLHTSAGNIVEIPFSIKIILSGTFLFNKQGGDWETSSEWYYGSGYEHKMLPNAASQVIISKPVTLNSHAEVYELWITDGGMLTIGANGGLTVYEGGVSSSNASQIHITSNHSGAGYLRISPNSSTPAPAVTTHYTTRSTLSTGANKDATWQYVGAPGDNCTVTTDGSQWLYLWDEQNGWVRKSGTVALAPFAGYAITQYGQPTYEWTSTMILRNQDIVLTKTAGGMDGANVFVNSYAAPIDVKRFSAEDFEGDMDKTFYLFNAGSWNQWNAGEADGTNLGKNGDDTPGHYCAIPALAASYIDPAYDITTIPPMQGVYVKTNADGAVIHLNYEKHVWKAADSNLNRPMRKATLDEDTEQPSFARVRIQANSNNSGADRLYVIQDTLFGRGYDNGYDAPKEIADGLMNLYVSEPFGQMEVSCSDRLDSTTIGFTAGEDTDYTLRFTSIVDEEALYLSDNESGLCIQIEEGMEYTFAARPYSTNSERFVLLRTPTANTPEGPTTDYENPSEPSVKSEGRLVMKNGQVYVVVGEQWYTLLGQSVQQK